MDLFTDKLSQKTTAQDIIRANTAADIEELNRWKQQAAEQRECLLKMGKLVDQGLEKLSRSQEDTEILNGIARENAERPFRDNWRIWSSPWSGCRNRSGRRKALSQGEWIPLPGHWKRKRKSRPGRP